MKTLLILSTLTILASCGKSTSTNDGSTSNAYGSTEGKACESNVVNDYNKLVGICNIQSSTNRTAILNCIDQADIMISKYPSLNCTATRYSRTTIEDETVIVNVDSIRKAQNGYTSEKYLNFKDGKSCGDFFMQDLANVVVENCKGFDLSSKYEVSSCKSSLDKLLVKYPNFDCSYKSSTGEIASYKFADFAEVQTELGKALE